MLVKVELLNSMGMSSGEKKSMGFHFLPGYPQKGDFISLGSEDDFTWYEVTAVSMYAVKEIPSDSAIPKYDGNMAYAIVIKEVKTDRGRT